MSSSGAGWPVHSVNAAAPWWSSISSPSSGRGAGRLGIAQQPGPGIDEVEHEQLVVQDLGRHRADVGRQADRRRVDEDLGLGDLGLDDRLVPRHRAQLHVRGRPAEVLDQPFGAVQVTVEHDDPLEALADQSEDDRPRAAARAQHDGLLRHLLASDERSNATLNPATSVLWPMRRLPSRVIVLTAPVDDASSVSRSTIGTTRSLCGIVTLAPRKSSDRELSDSLGELDRGAIPQLVPGVDPELVEGGLLHRAGQRMGDRMADEDDALRHARTPSRSAKKPG